jgi:hypothetical protein
MSVVPGEIPDCVHMLGGAPFVIRLDVFQAGGMLQEGGLVGTFGAQVLDSFPRTLVELLEVAPVMLVHAASRVGMYALESLLEVPGKNSNSSHTANIHIGDVFRIQAGERVSRIGGKSRFGTDQSRRACQNVISPKAKYCDESL